VKILRLETKVLSIRLREQQLGSTVTMVVGFDRGKSKAMDLI
jgi:hypothetical protein